MLAEVVLQPHSSCPRNENLQFVWKWKLLPFNVALVRINSILSILPVSLGQTSVFTVSTAILFSSTMIICPNKNKSPDSGAEGFSGSSLTGAALNGNKCRHTPPPPSNDLICNLVIGSRYHRTTVLGGARCKQTVNLSQGPGSRAGRRLQLQEGPLGGQRRFCGVQETSQETRPEEDPNL